MTTPPLPDLGGISTAELEAGWPVVQERLRRLTEAFAISSEDLVTPKLAEAPTSASDCT